MSATLELNYGEGLAKYWLLVLPLAYVVHISEEYFGGEGFAAHLARTKGVTMTPAHFLILTSVGGACVLTGVMMAILWSKHFYWTPVIIGTAFALNGLSHALNAIVTGKYNPGLVTGVAVWLPLGAFAAFHARRRTRRKIFILMIAIGFAAQLIVSLLALKSGKLFGS